MRVGTAGSSRRSSRPGRGLGGGLGRQRRQGAEAVRLDSGTGPARPEPEPRVVRARRSEARPVTCAGSSNGCPGNGTCWQKPWPSSRRPRGTACDGALLFHRRGEGRPPISWGLAEMCRVLEVSRSGFYDWELRGPSDRELSDAQLAIEIEAIFIASNRTYGAPRVHAWLRRQGRGRSQAGGPDHAPARLRGRDGPAQGEDHHRRRRPPRRGIWCDGPSTRASPTRHGAARSPNGHRRGLAVPGRGDRLVQPQRYRPCPGRPHAHRASPTHCAWPSPPGEDASPG